ncbi:MAG TPA: mucoidy inhibitor MuiA family protein [Bacteroidales bacterium]|nr:mucoidy inhibitor MuiA family protein [Bacteroidales bacterium]
MKKVLAAIVLIFCGLNLSAQAEKEIKAGIKHVTVFPDRAQVNHETAVSLIAGRTVLKLSGLSPYIDPQSIQVKGFGEFTILSVNHQNNYLKNLEDDPGIKSIRSQIEALQLKSEDEKAAIAILQEKASFLTANKALLLKEASVTTEQIKSIMDLYTSNYEQVTLSVLKKQRQIKEYEKQIAALEQQASSRQKENQLPSGEIYVTVSNEKQVTGKLDISYVATNAGWYPSYDIRVDDIKKPVSISYKANVYQSTGNSWENVKLSFSNATPWVSGNIPELYPWFIDFIAEPRPLPVARYNSAKRKEITGAVISVAADESVEEAPLPEPASGPEIMIQTGETTVTFDVTVPFSVPSDGKMQTVEIQDLDLPADYKYVTLPKKSELAYLTANITNWAELSLQSGEATLYFENSFVGKSWLNVNQLTDTLTVSLGTDNSILVKREKRKDFTSSKVLGSNKTETRSFLITVRNNKQNPVKITIKDQIPVSSNSGIEVQPVELTGGRYNPGNGYVFWDVEMKPGESKQLILTYTVKHPKDKNLILE